MRYHLLFLVTFLILQNVLCYSEEVTPVCPKLTIFFTNGIQNDKRLAKDNLNKLRTSIRESHFNNDIHTKVGNYRYTDLKFRLNYNQTEWGPNDFLEVFNFDDFSDEYDQGLPGYLDKHHNALYKENVEVSWPVFKLEWYSEPIYSLDLSIESTSYWSLVRKYLENNADPDFRKLIDEKIQVSIDSDAADITEHLQAYKEEYQARRKIVTVSHSEGNFFANLEYQAIEGLGDPLMHESMAIVSVGNPDSKVEGYSSLPESERYITFDEDRVINLSRITGGYGASSLPANYSLWDDAYSAETKELLLDRERYQLEKAVKSSGYYADAWPLYLQNHGLPEDYEIKPPLVPLDELITGGDWKEHSFIDAYMHYPGSRDFIVEKVFELADGVERPAALQGDEIESRFYLETDENGDTFASKTEFNLQDPLPSLPQMVADSELPKESIVNDEKMSSRFFMSINSDRLSDIRFGPAFLATERAKNFTFEPSVNHVVFKKEGDSLAPVFTPFRYQEGATAIYDIVLPPSSKSMVKISYIDWEAEDLFDAPPSYREIDVPQSFQMKFKYEENKESKKFVDVTVSVNGVTYPKYEKMISVSLPTNFVFVSFDGQGQVKCDLEIKSNLTGYIFARISENWDVVGLSLSPQLEDIPKNVLQKLYRYSIKASNSQKYSMPWTLILTAMHNLVDTDYLYESPSGYRSRGPTALRGEGDVNFVFDRATLGVYKPGKEPDFEPRVELEEQGFPLWLYVRPVLASLSYWRSSHIAQGIYLGEASLMDNAFVDYFLMDVQPRIFEPYVTDDVVFNGALAVYGKLPYEEEYDRSVCIWSAIVDIIDGKDNVLRSFETGLVVVPDENHVVYTPFIWDGKIDRDTNGRDIVDLREVHRLFARINWKLHRVAEDAVKFYDYTGREIYPEFDGEFEGGTLIAEDVEKIEIMHPCITD